MGDNGGIRTSHGGGGRPRSMTARAGTLAGLTVMFGAVMTGQAFSEPGRSDAPGRPQEAPAKVMLCHATGSATNPYVLITVSENGLHGHDGHEGDIVPAPAGGCPEPQAIAEGRDGGGDRVRPEPAKVTLCHATESATNPYVVITISENGLHGHDGHEGDIVPAPADGCPAPAAAPPSTTTTTTPASVAPATVPEPTVERAAVPAAPADVAVAAPPPAVGVETRVLASVQSALGSAASPSTPPLFRLESFAGPAPVTPGIAPAVLGATIERSGATLPRTGGELSALATSGLGLLVLGAALELAGRRRPAPVATTAG